MGKGKERSLGSVLRAFLCLSADKPVKRSGGGSSPAQAQPAYLVAQEDNSTGLHVHVVEHGATSRYPSWIGWHPDTESAPSKAVGDGHHHSLKAAEACVPDHTRESLRLPSDCSTVLAAAERAASGAAEASAPKAICCKQSDMVFKEACPASPCVATSQISMASVTSGSEAAAQYGFQAAPWEHRSAYSFTYAEGEGSTDKSSPFRQQSGFEVSVGSMGDLSNLSQRSTTSSNGSARALQPGLLSAKLRQSSSGTSRASPGGRDLPWQWANARQGRGQGKYATWQQLQQRRWWQQFQHPMQLQQQILMSQQLQQQHLQQPGRMPVTIDEDRSLRGVRDYIDGAAVDAPERPLTPAPKLRAGASTSPDLGPAAHPLHPDAPVLPMIQSHGFCLDPQLQQQQGPNLAGARGGEPAPVLLAPRPQLQLPRGLVPDLPPLSPHLMDFEQPPARRSQHPRLLHSSDVIRKLPASDSMSGDHLLPNGKVSVGSTLETSSNALK